MQQWGECGKQLGHSDQLDGQRRGTSEWPPACHAVCVFPSGLPDGLHILCYRWVGV